MPLNTTDTQEVDRAEALLEGLSDDDKREVVRMVYVDSSKSLEEAVQEKRAKLVAINTRLAKIEELASRVGAELEPEPMLTEPV